MKRQQRLTFARVGVIDPRSGDDHTKYQGNKGLRAALGMTPAEVVEAVVDSGLRGRGGAGFPTGIKWRTVLGAESSLKFVCCNADEGDSGTFADRMLIEGDPFTLIEGMTIAAYAVGATEGYVYLRSEYPDAVEALSAAIVTARERGWLGENILDSGLTFDLHVRVGAGAYICGEETSMLESLEGKRGMVRAKPPIPALEGLFGRPTVVNNVLSLATIPTILANGAAAYSAYGMGRSLGTNVFQLGGNIARGGIVETAFGITLGELVNDLGGGTASGRPTSRSGAGSTIPRSGLAFCSASSSTCRWITSRSLLPGRWSGTAGSWSSTRPWTCPRWRGSRSSSAPRSRAANARPAGSARSAASRRSTGSGTARTGRRTSCCSTTCVT